MVDFGAKQSFARKAISIRHHLMSMMMMILLRRVCTIRRKQINNKILSLLT